MEITKEEILLAFCFPKFTRHNNQSRFINIFNNPYSSQNFTYSPLNAMEFEKINLKRVMKGEDKRTTLILKNIPKNLSKSDIQIILSGVGNINYFYMPINRSTMENDGFAFVNIINYRNIVDVIYKLEEQKQINEAFQPIKIIYSRIQGKKNLSLLFYSKKSNKF